MVEKVKNDVRNAIGRMISEITKTFLASTRLGDPLARTGRRRKMLPDSDNCGGIA